MLRDHLQRLDSLVVEASDVKNLRRIILALALAGHLDDQGVSTDGAAPGSSTNIDEVAEEAARALQVDSLKCGFKRLSDLAMLKKGLTPIKRAEPGRFPLVVTANERMTCDHYDFEGPAAIIPLVSSSGHGKASLKRLHYQKGRFALGTILCAVLPKNPEHLSARFLYEYLSAFKDELLVSRMVGTANVTLTVEKIGQVPVPLISTSAVARLDELMALCDELEAELEKRELRRDELRQAVLDPLLRLAHGASYTDENVQSLLDCWPRLITNVQHFPAIRKMIFGLAVHGQLVQQSSLGWTMTTLGSVCSQITDGTHRTPTYVVQGVPFVSIKDFSDGFLDFSATRLISPAEHEQLIRRCKPEKGDVLLGRIGTLGKPVVVTDDREFSLFVSVGLLKPRRSIIMSEYLRLFLDSPMAEKEFDRIKVGAGTHTNKLNLGDLKTVSLPLPPLAEQQHIVTKVEHLMALSHELQSALARAQTDRAQVFEALLNKTLDAGSRE